MIVGGGLFSSLVYGLSNKYRYRMHRVQLAFDNLPAGFKGLKLSRCPTSIPGVLQTRRP